MQFFINPCLSYSLANTSIIKTMMTEITFRDQSLLIFMVGVGAEEKIVRQRNKWKIWIHGLLVYRERGEKKLSFYWIPRI